MSYGPCYFCKETIHSSNNHTRCLVNGQFVTAHESCTADRLIWEAGRNRRRRTCRFKRVRQAIYQSAFPLMAVAVLWLLNKLYH